MAKSTKTSKKQPWEQLTAAEQKKVAAEVVKKTKPEAEEPATRKMVRIGDAEHAMAKKAAVLLELGLQEYIEQLIREDVARRFPNIAK